MKNIIKLAGVAAVAVALTQSVQAIPLAPITGNIGFGGGVEYNSSSAGTATEVTAWITPIVVLDSGTFSSIALGTSATFTSQVWSFVTGSPGINNFWAVGGFTFQLLTSSVLNQGGTYPNGFVVVTGTGTVTATGYAPTTMSWSFTSQDPEATGSDINGNPAWSFSASAASVPDGGATVMLLGIALSGAALLRKKLMA